MVVVICKVRFLCLRHFSRLEVGGHGVVVAAAAAAAAVVDAAAAAVASSEH